MPCKKPARDGDINRRIDRLITEGHPLAEFLQDQRDILKRLDDLIARPIRDDEPLDRLEAQIRPRERAMLAANLIHEIEAIERDAELEQAGAPVIDLARFGAVGDGKHDDGPALRAAFAALRELPPGTTLSLPEGRFRVAELEAHPLNTHLLVDGLEDVTVRGAGMMKSQIVGGRIGSVLRMENCRRVKVADIGLDLDPLPMTQGKVIATDPEAFTMDWETDEGWSSPLEFPFNVSGDPREHVNAGVHTHCPRTGRVLPRAGFSVGRMEPLGGRKFRFHHRQNMWNRDKPFPENLEPGLPAVLGCRGITGGLPALWTASTEYCTFERFAVYSSWHNMYQFVGDTSLKLIDCVSEPMPGTDRIAAPTSDGLHIISQRIGPYVKGCRLKRQYDDSTNYYCRVVSIDHQPEARRLVLDAAFDPDDRAVRWQPDHRAFRVGDQLAVLCCMTGEIVDLPTVTAKRETRWRGACRVEVELDRPLPPLRTRDTLGKHYPVFTNTEFFGYQPEDATEHMVVNLQTKSDGFVLRDTYLGQNSVNAIKLKASNGLVIGNHFDENASIGITACMRIPWQEAFPPRNVLITDNRFTGCTGICTTIDYPGGRKRFGPSYLADLIIERNTFVGTRHGVFDLHNLRDSRIADNTYDTDGDGRVLAAPSAYRLELDARMAEALGRPEMEASAE